YFGALAYAPGSPYHNGNGACAATDHSCVDGLTCAVDGAGNFACSNANIDRSGTPVFAYHNSRRCAPTNLDRSWLHTHRELNYLHPNWTLKPASDGFVRIDQLVNSGSSGAGSEADSQTMAFYNQEELPFYYQLA